MENKFKVWSLRVAAVLFVLVLGTAVMCSGMFARFVSYASGGDGARVARFDFKVSEILFDHVSLNGTRDDTAAWQNVTAEYTGAGGHNITMYPSNGDNFFKYSFANDSEVAVAVTITVETLGNIPLRLDFEETISSSHDTKTKTSETYTMELAPRESGSVYLWVDWPNPNDQQYNYLWTYNYSSEIDNMTVTIDCRQID